MADSRGLLSTLIIPNPQISLLWAENDHASRLDTCAKIVLSVAVKVARRTDDAKGFAVLPRHLVLEGAS